jgi:Holliday junction resolvasome RuvABC endonuclease subunit
VVIGINSTQDAIYIAETSGSDEAFAVDKITRLQYELSEAAHISDLLKNLKAILAALRTQQPDTIALLCCSSGKFGSSIEAIKAEAIVQLAAHECGFTVIEVKPQSLKSALGCAKDEKWQGKSKELFNPDGLHQYWSQGANGSAAAAYKAASN